MRRAVLAALAVILIALSGALSAPAAKAPRCSQSYPLHGGSARGRASCGQRVKDVQWLLGGHRPSVYSKTAPTFKAKPNGLYGARTKAAVKAMKFRIGYPTAGQCGARSSEVTDTAGALLVRILKGKPRPTCWVGLAARRIKGAVVPGATSAALRIRDLELRQLGTTEQPLGSNRGPRISFTSAGYGPYQGSTGAFGLAWCASFGDWALKSVTGHGFGSANDAYVPTIAEYAQAHGWLQAKPRLGSYVIYLDRAGNLASAYHIGYVVKLVGGSGVETIEGNYADAVHEVYRTFAANLMVYVDVPGVA